MKKWNKLLALLLAMVMAFGMAVTAFAEGEETTETTETTPTEETTEATETPAEGEETPAAEETAKEDIVILHTNDAHGKYNSDIGYAGIAAYKAEMAKDNYVALVDAGDFSQGAAIAILSKGENLVKIMNQVGYDIVVPGNHEFDYGLEQGLKNLNDLDATVLSCNFIDLKAETPVFDAYKLVEYGETTVAYVGLSTPDTYTKSTPTYFMEGEEYIYSFSENEDEGKFYAVVQGAVDAAIAEGADYVVAVGHMGTDEQSSPYTSKEIIANTTGINAFIDGHSHSTIENEQVANKDGKNVVLAQTGNELGKIGKLTIKKDGTITSELVTEYTEKDETATAFIAEIEASFKEYTSQVVAKSEVDLIAKKADDSWAVRDSETNMGDLIADAYRIVMDADIGIMNGGGIRANIPAGDVTIDNILSVMTFGNMATVVKVTGQQILDCLEMGAASFPGASGGFTHVSGMTYNIDTSIESSVVKDEKKDFVSVDGPYRVTNVMVGDEPLDLEKTYSVACHSYWLTKFGDGMTMFKGAELVNEKHEKYVDNVMLSMYIQENLGGVVGAEYAAPQGRITINGCNDITSNRWYFGSAVYATEKGLIDAVDGAFLPNEAMTRADFVTALYRLAGSPEVTGENVFTDVADDAAYKNAVIWANECGYVNGITETTFAPDGTLQRQQIAAILYRAVKPEAAEGDLSVFTDADSVQAYATDAVKWMVSIELLKGSNGAINARGAISRAEAATILMRFEEKGLTFAEIETEETTEGETEATPDTEETVEEPAAEKTFETIAVTVKNGDRDVPAVVTMPVGEGPFAAVVLNHGHGGSKDENVGFIGVAEALAEAGIASIRMDFPGCGESTEPFTEENQTNRISDSNACKDYLLTNYNVDPDRLGILGYSMGGRTAALIVGEENNPYQAMVLLAGAVGSGEDLAYGMVGGEENYAAAYETAKTEGKYTVTTIYGQVLDYSAKWFDDTIALDPLAGAANFDGPVLVMYGDEDVVVPAEVNKLSLEAYSNATEIVIPGSNHSYGFYPPYSDELTAMVEGGIVEFFAEALVAAVEAAA